MQYQLLAYKNINKHKTSEIIYIEILQYLFNQNTNITDEVNLSTCICIRIKPLFRQTFAHCTLQN